MNGIVYHWNKKLNMEILSQTHQYIQHSKNLKPLHEIHSKLVTINVKRAVYIDIRLAISSNIQYGKELISFNNLPVSG